MNLMHLLAAACLATALPSVGFAADVPCDSDAIAQAYSDLHPWRASDAVGFVARGLAVDADGAPNSYRVDGNGLSYTCDGSVGIVNGHRVTPKTNPEHWQAVCRDAWTEAHASNDYSSLSIFGFLTDGDNHPVVQGAGDPLPGDAYITTTTMSVPGTPAGTQRHWVDAVEIPYVVLSPSFAQAFGVKLGDVAAIYRPNTQALAFAVFADTGDLGEGSVRLHVDLRHDPMITKGGIERAKSGIGDRVAVLVFPGVATTGTTDAEAWRVDIAAQGGKALAAWGGIDRLRACAK